MLKPLVFLQHQYKLKWRFTKPSILLFKRLWYDSKVEVMQAINVGNQVVYKLGDNSIKQGLVTALGDFTVFVNEQAVCVTKICMILK